MRITTIFLDENKIEIYNSIFGKETIKVNDKIVSEKHSLFGAKHIFNIIENGNSVECMIDIGLSINGVVFDLHKANNPIIVSPKNGFPVFLTLVLGIVVVFSILGKIF